MIKVVASACGLAAAASGAWGEAPATPDEVRSIVAEMLAEAETRSSLLQGGGSGGWDGGFLVRSADEGFTLKIEGQLQFQFVAGLRDADDEYDNDFSMRRAKLFFSGRVFDDWSYLINGAFGRSSGDFLLEDARVSRELGEGGPLLTVGQFKSGFLLEERTSAKRQLGTDRSYLNEWFTIDRTQGVALSDQHERSRWWVMISDGVVVRATGLNGEGSNSDLGTNNTDFALTAGAAWLLGEEATWAQFRDLTSDPEAPMAGRLGLAGHYQTGSDIGAGAEQDVFTATSDLSVEFGGASAQAWGVWQSIEDAGGVSGADFDQWGVGAQAAAFIHEDQWELFGRWEHLDFDDALGAGREGSLDLLTVGMTRYFHGHALKWVTQVVYALDEVPVSRTHLGLRADAPGDDGQIGFVSQIQVLF
jgi:hypothetical protein